MQGTSPARRIADHQAAFNAVGLCFSARQGIAMNSTSVLPLSPRSASASRRGFSLARARLALAGSVLAVAAAWAGLPQAARAQATPAAPAAASGQAADGAAVGTVTLHIGQARVVRRDGTVLALRLGAPVHVGDRIETAANGQVHVRFVDNGNVAVRPESVLEVQAYRFDAANPSGSEVRLRLAEGVARSISGTATEADKSRFRLNTPLAAIGVRGTDFIVQASAAGSRDSRATVAAGAIVMAPLGNGCAAEGLGPCSGRAAQLLSADMGRLMVELRSGERAPRLVPAVETLVASGLPVVDQRLAARALALAAAQPSLTDPRSANNDRAAAQLLSIAPLGPFDAAEIRTPADRSAQLAWGRWFSLVDASAAITLSFDEAAAGRNITVGDGIAGLWRKGKDEDVEAAMASSRVTRADFRLTRAQATYEKDNRSEAASVDGGTLSLDFLNRSFATALALSSPTAGKSELRMAGEVRKDGTFAVRDAESRIAGAVSADLKEAGYFFERSAGGGLFRGRTLWGR
jgi:hypothetical protein